MEFEWDLEKERLNITNHGIDFATAVKIFEGPVYSRHDNRFDYGEIREVSTGLIASQKEIVVIHTDVIGALRIISARRATKRERKDYYEYCARQT